MGHMLLSEGGPLVAERHHMTLQECACERARERESLEREHARLDPNPTQLNPQTLMYTLRGVANGFLHL